MAVSIASTVAFISRFPPEPSSGNGLPSERGLYVLLSCPTVSIGPGRRSVNSRARGLGRDSDMVRWHPGTGEPCHRGGGLRTSLIPGRSLADSRGVVREGAGD